MAEENLCPPLPLQSMYFEGLNEEIRSRINPGYITDIHALMQRAREVEVMIDSSPPSSETRILPEDNHPPPLPIKQPPGSSSVNDVESCLPRNHVPSTTAKVLANAPDSLQADGHGLIEDELSMKEDSEDSDDSNPDKFWDYETYVPRDILSD